ncbi:MAG: tetratricopeptide repeat protein [Endomicrobiales bacterium]
MEETQRRIEEGKTCFQEGRYREAVESYTKALENDPGNGQVLFELGKTCYVAQDFRAALQWLEKTSRALPGDGQAHRNARLLLAKTCRAAGEYARAARIAGELLKKHRDDEEVREEYSLATRERYGSYVDASSCGGDYRSLTEEYRRRLEADPDDERALVGIAQAYNFLGQHEPAARAAEEALKRIPQGEVFLRNKLTSELEIARGATVLGSRARSLAVTLSNRCNISCIMCLTSKNRWEMPEERLEELRSLFPYLEKVMWQGGEVFFLPYFRALVAEAGRYPHLRQSIVTNGQLLNEEIAEELVKNNIELTFSVDGARKETYEHIRRGARFENLTRSIRAVKELRGGHRSPFVMNMNVAVMRSNYRELKELVAFAAENTFDFVCLMPINTHLETPENIFARPDDAVLETLADESDAIDEIARQTGIRVENRLPRRKRVSAEGAGPEKEAGREPAPEEQRGGNPPPRRLCHLPWLQLLLDYDGSVRPDCLCPEDRRAGSLRESPVEKLWNNEMMQKYREVMARGGGNDFCNRHCIEGKISEEHLKFVKP